VSQESPATTFSEEEFWTDDLVEAFQEEYVDELPDLFVAEAEAEEHLRQGVQAMSVPDSSSKTKKQKKTPLVRCRVCKDPFDTIDTYHKHLMGHAMKGGLLMWYSHSSIRVLSFKGMKLILFVSILQRLALGHPLWRGPNFLFQTICSSEVGGSSPGDGLRSVLSFVVA